MPMNSVQPTMTANNNRSGNLVSNNASNINIPGSGINEGYLPYVDVGGSIVGRDAGLNIAGKMGSNKSYSKLKPWDKVVGMYVEKNTEEALKQGYTQESPNVLSKIIGNGVTEVLTINPSTGETIRTQRLMREATATPEQQSDYNRLNEAVKAFKTESGLVAKSGGYDNPNGNTRLDRLSRTINAYQRKLGLKKGKTSNLSFEPTVEEAIVEKTSLGSSEDFYKSSMQKSPSYGGNLRNNVWDNLKSDQFFGGMNIKTPDKKSINPQEKKAVNSGNDLTGMAIFGFTDAGTERVTPLQRSSPTRINPFNFNGFSSNNPLLNTNNNVASRSSQSNMGFSSNNPFLNTDKSVNPFLTKAPSTPTIARSSGGFSSNNPFLSSDEFSFSRKKGKNFGENSVRDRISRIVKW